MSGSFPADWKYNYDVFSLTFGGATSDLEIEIQGERLRLLTGTVDITVKLNYQSERAIPLTKKQDLVGPFTRLYISTAGAGTVTVMVSMPYTLHMTGTQVDVDEVNNLKRDDSPLYRTDLLKAFLGGLQKAAVAGQYAYSEFWNPAASGVTAYIRTVLLSAGGTDWLYLRSHDAAVGVEIGTEKLPKYVGGAQPLCEIRVGAAAAVPGTARGIIPFPVASASSLLRVPFIDNIRVPVGTGVILACRSVNVDMNVSWEWFEV